MKKCNGTAREGSSVFRSPNHPKSTPLAYGSSTGIACGMGTGIVCTQVYVCGVLSPCPRCLASALYLCLQLKEI